MGCLRSLLGSKMAKNPFFRSFSYKIMSEMKYKSFPGYSVKKIVDIHAWSARNINFLCLSWVYYHIKISKNVIIAIISREKATEWSGTRFLQDFHRFLTCFTYFGRLKSCKIVRKRRRKLSVWYPEQKYPIYGVPKVTFGVKNGQKSIFRSFSYPDL